MGVKLEILENLNTLSNLRLKNGRCDSNLLFMDWLLNLLRNQKFRLPKESRADLEQLEHMLSESPVQPERELADDEEERIFYDKETGTSRVEVVKKSAGKIAVEKEFERLRHEEATRYPHDAGSKL